MSAANFIWEAYTNANPHNEDAYQLAKGIKVETEHLTPNEKKMIDAIPVEVLVKIIDIALDHLAEDKSYYTKLSKLKL